MKKIPFNQDYLTISFHAIFTGVLLYLSIKIIASLGEILGVFAFIIHAFLPLIIGILFAYFFEPLITILNLKVKLFISKYMKISDKKYRIISCLLVYILFLFIVIALLTLLVYSITGNLRKVNIEMLKNKILLFNNESVENIIDLISSFGFDSTSITKILEKINSFINSFINSILSIIMSFGNMLIICFLGWIIGIYLSIDKEYFIKGIKKILHIFLNDNSFLFLAQFTKDAERVFFGYIRGQIMDAFIIIILTSASLSIIRVPNAVLIAAIAGIFNLIPFFGPIVGVILSTILALSSGNLLKAFLSFLTMVAISQIDGNIINPKIMGKYINIHPVTTIMAVVIGGALFNLPGMFFSVPIVALIKLLFLKWEEKKNL